MATDKRIIKTKKSIMTAFMQLAIEKDASKITVSDLAAKALVNRSTFYLHYEDTNAVMKDIEAEFAYTVSACIKRFDVSDVYSSVYNMLSNLSEALQDNDIYKQYITCSSNSNRVSDRMKQILVERTIDAILQAYPDTDQRSIVYPLTFAAAGIVDCFIKWAKNSDMSITLEALIEQISGLTEAVIKNFS